MNGLRRLLREIFMPLGIPLAWLQLTSNRPRFFMALAGTACSAMLMLFQISAYGALLKTKVVRSINGMDADLIIVSRNSLYLLLGNAFPRTRIAQAASLPGVAESAPMFINIGIWKTPGTGYGQRIVAFGVDPGHPVFRNPGVREHLAVLTQADAMLYDSASPGSFGPVREAIAAHGSATAEVNGRRIQLRGLFTMGPTLASESQLIAGTQAFFRLFPDRSPDLVDLGAIRLEPGVDPDLAAVRMRARLPDDVLVYTKTAFAAREADYWANRSQLSFAVFAMMMVALLTGAVVVYQILYTDVNEHLPEYATLKAIGLTDRFLKRLVLGEAILLHLLAFILGCLLTEIIFRLVATMADLPLRMEFRTLVLVFLFTGAMCGTAGLLATRRLRSADPADTF